MANVIENGYMKLMDKLVHYGYESFCCVKRLMFVDALHSFFDEKDGLFKPFMTPEDVQAAHRVEAALYDTCELLEQPDEDTIYQAANKDHFKSYSVTFVDGWLGEAVEQSVRRGDSAVPPTFKRDNYRFTGWDSDEWKNVTRNCVITAQWQINTYKVKVKMEDDFVFYSNIVDSGSDILNKVTAAREKVEKLLEGKHFREYDKNPQLLTNVTSDIEMTAFYDTDTFSIYAHATEEISSDIAWQINGVAYGTLIQDAIAQTDATYRKNYSSASDGLGTLNGYSPEDKLTSDVNLYYQHIAKEFTVKYVLDGVLYKSYNQKYGEATKTPDVPAKTGYTFSGWSTIPAIVTGNTTITGFLNVNKFKVTFKVGSTTVKEQTDVPYGSFATAPTTAQISAAVPAGKKFVAWKESFDSVKSNLVINAEISDIIYTLKVRKMSKIAGERTPVNLKVVADIKCKYGDSILTLINNQTGIDKTITGGTFENWCFEFNDTTKYPQYTDKKEVVATDKIIGDNIVVTAMYSLNLYDVKWNSHYVKSDGTEETEESKAITKSYGSYLTDSDIYTFPQKVGYNLEEINTDPVNFNKNKPITCDVTLTAEYKAKPANNTYSFYKGELLTQTNIQYEIIKDYTKTVAVDDIIVMPALPAATSTCTYNVWTSTNSTGATVTYKPGDKITVTAAGNRDFNAIPVHKEFTVKFYTVENGKEIEIQSTTNKAFYKFSSATSSKNVPEAKYGTHPTDTEECYWYMIKNGEEIKYDYTTDNIVTSNQSWRLKTIKTKTKANVTLYVNVVTPFQQFSYGGFNGTIDPVAKKTTYTKRNGIDSGSVHIDESIGSFTMYDNEDHTIEFKFDNASTNILEPLDDWSISTFDKNLFDNENISVSLDETSKKYFSYSTNSESAIDLRYNGKAETENLDLKITFMIKDNVPFNINYGYYDFLGIDGSNKPIVTISPNIGYKNITNKSYIRSDSNYGKYTTLIHSYIIKAGDKNKQIIKHIGGTSLGLSTNIDLASSVPQVFLTRDTTGTIGSINNEAFGIAKNALADKKPTNTYSKSYVGPDWLSLTGEDSLVQKDAYTKVARVLYGLVVESEKELENVTINILPRGYYRPDSNQDLIIKTIRAKNTYSAAANVKLVSDGEQYESNTTFTMPYGLGDGQSTISNSSYSHGAIQYKKEYVASEEGEAIIPVKVFVTNNYDTRMAQLAVTIREGSTTIGNVIGTGTIALYFNNGKFSVEQSIANCAFTTAARDKTDAIYVGNTSKKTRVYLKLIDGGELK